MVPLRCKSNIEPYNEFRLVLDRLESVETADGVTVHESCRTTFRNRISRKETSNSNLPPLPPPPPSDSEESATSNSHHRPNRDKEPKKKSCFVCKVPDDGTPYNDGGVGRCQMDSSKES